jgi:hypothetical protein
MKKIVLCLNDFPIGVYDSTQLADAAADRDWKRREPCWEAQGLKFKESLSGWGSNAYKFSKWFYHQHEFEVNAEAHL